MRDYLRFYDGSGFWTLSLHSCAIQYNSEHSALIFQLNYASSSSFPPF